VRRTDINGEKEVKRLAADDEYVRDDSISEISAEEAQRKFVALKADLVKKGANEASKLQSVNAYARDLNGATATGKNCSFMFKEELWGS
jgi:lipase chaperone LimK